jgi:hypothetical protein
LLEAAAAALDGTPFALWAARNPLAYPVANTLHVIGLALLLGPVALLDLRILGAFGSLPLPALSSAVTRLAAAGLVLLLASGPVLFAADAVSLAGSLLFGWKLGLIALATGNALLFRLTAPDGTAARLMAGVSLAAWTSAAVLGRWIAYG